ncbi:uncharacterized protein LOC123873207 [Maniola jurtina]|uniref:uncharacterized protein LOC123873207 n=1 Tax=Maniola jurtina TaxID=191418 RepID=UPI001E68839F|nr:uncharacterized protein LOC123873207 [Maniola jurtina]
MISFDYMSRVCFLYLAVLLTTVYTEDVCVKKGPCTCEFPNGTGIDLTPTAKATFFNTQTYKLENSGARLALSTFYYHPCSDIVLPINTSAAATTTCKDSLALCWYISYMDLLNTTKDTFKKDGGNYQYLGTSNYTTFSPDGKSITYPNVPSSTVVMLVCATTEDRLEVYSLDDPSKVVLAFYSKDACLKQIEEPGRSLGSTLLIIFFSFVILYIVLGVCTKKFLMGATGLEVIPNLAFWSDLPNLVKDGWAFAINGFKLPARGAGPATSPDPNSYDSI